MSAIKNSTDGREGGKGYLPLGNGSAGDQMLAGTWGEAPSFLTFSSNFFF